MKQAIDYGKDVKKEVINKSIGSFKLSKMMIFLSSFHFELLTFHCYQLILIT